MSGYEGQYGLPVVPYWIIPLKTQRAPFLYLGYCWITLNPKPKTLIPFNFLFLGYSWVESFAAESSVVPTGLGSAEIQGV